MQKLNDRYFRFERDPGGESVIVNLDQVRFFQADPSPSQQRMLIHFSDTHRISVREHLQVFQDRLLDQ